MSCLRRFLVSHAVATSIVVIVVQGKEGLFTVDLLDVLHRI